MIRKEATDIRCKSCGAPAVIEINHTPYCEECSKKESEKDKKQMDLFNK